MEFYKYKHQNKLLWICGKLLDILFFKKIRSYKKNKIVPESIKKILVFESHLIGDCIMTTALISGLKEIYPNAKIDILANSWMSNLLTVDASSMIYTVKVPWSTYNYRLKNLTHFFKTIFQLRKNRYDLSIETRGEIRNTLTLLFVGSKFRIGVDVAGGTLFLTDPVSNKDPFIPNYKKRIEILKYLGWQHNELKPEVYISSEEKLEVSNFLKENNLSKHNYIVFHPGGSSYKKSFSIEQVINLFEDCRGAQVVIAYGPREKELVDSLKIQISSKNIAFNPIYFTGSFGSYCELCKYAQFAITSDSAPAHLCDAVGTKCIVICPHDRPDVVKPSGSHNIMLKFSDIANNFTFEKIINVI